MSYNVAEMPRYLDKSRGSGAGRRTVKEMHRSDYLSPDEILRRISHSAWQYKVGERQSQDTVEKLKLRDKALVCCLYVLALRVSEALRLKQSDFSSPIKDSKGEYIAIDSIKLSKSKLKGVPRRYQYREGWLPLAGERAPFTHIILDYLKLLGNEENLFPFGTARAWQIVTTITGCPPHYFRAFGEDYLYSAWGKDSVAVSDYVKVNIKTFSEYVKQRGLKYGVV